MLPILFICWRYAAAHLLFYAGMPAGITRASSHADEKWKPRHPAPPITGYAAATAYFFHVLRVFARSIFDISVARSWNDLLVFLEIY